MTFKKGVRMFESRLPKCLANKIKPEPPVTLQLPSFEYTKYKCCIFKIYISPFDTDNNKPINKCKVKTVFHNKETSTAFKCCQTEGQVKITTITNKIPEKREEENKEHKSDNLFYNSEDFIKCIRKWSHFFDNK